MPDDETEAVAEAIYMTHWRAPSPPWKDASEEVRAWVRKQAAAAVAVIDQCRSGTLAG